jgi:hypothetical protein
MFSASFCKRVLAVQLGTLPLLLHALHRHPQQTRRKAKIKKRRKKRKRKRRQVLNSRDRRPRVRQHATREVCSR